MIKDFFDYHYYRVAKFYYKKDGADAVTAIISVSAVQSWVIINFFLFGKEVFFSDVKVNYDYVFWIGIMIGFMLYNRKRYKNKYQQLRAKWIHEKKRKKFKNGIVIILTIILAWTLIFVNVYLINKFK